MHIHSVTKSRPASASTTTGALDGILGIIQTIVQVLGVLSSITSFINSLVKTTN